MVVVAGLAGFAAGLAAGGVWFRRERHRHGTSWEQWRDASEQVPEGRRMAIGLVVSVWSFFALVGHTAGIPGWLQAALAGSLVGLCLPFAAEGVRRRV